MTKQLVAFAVGAALFGSSLGAALAAPAAVASPAAAAKPTAAASAKPVPTTSAKPAPAASAKPKATPKPEPTPATPFSYLKWRDVGPALPGGRVTAVVGSATDNKLYYLGAAGGGVWKSSDGAATWTAVFSKEPVASIGAIALDPTNNSTVYVGTGETDPRNDVSFGDGIYKSTTGGAKWTHLGLARTRNISNILIDPKNPNIVLVGALGDPFRNSTHRGVYRSTNGGVTWKQTLYVGPADGVSDMSMDPSDPNVIYAGIWQFRRKPWTFHSGGPEDGLYKSTDGGKTWAKIVGHGMPKGPIGKIAVAVAPSNPQRVYALIESRHGLLFRSDDAGANWKMVSNDTLVDQRPFYFTKLAVNPKNANQVYAISMMVAMSVNGGMKFNVIAPSVHVDFHSMWIDPNDPMRIILGEDGGYALTLDGTHWSFSRNLPIGQVYHIGLSQNENPYTICGGWQDNNAWCFPSNSLDPSGILSRYVVSVNGGDGEWAVPDPIDPNWIWSDSENGALVVYNRVTQDAWSAQPYFGSAAGLFDIAKTKYRFNWDSPIAFAPWNGNIAWIGAQKVFQTTDRGKHWTVISPDLTLNDKAHQIPSGGPVTYDVSGAEYSDTILDIEGSHKRKGEIWVGTDDGLVQLTLDGGKHWKNVTPPGVPPYGRVETVAPSLLDAATAYVSIDRHRSGDYKPYLFVTHNYGKTWTSLAAKLPQNVYVRTVRPDFRNPAMFFVGTETGIFVSFDSGKSYYNFKNNLPTASVRDIREQRQFNDLVIATHGRAVWIMDDLTGLQQLGAAMAQGDMLFPIRTTYQYSLHSNDEGIYTRFAGDNPPNGAIITYYQKTKAKKNIQAQISDSKGRLVRTLKGTMDMFGHNVPLTSNRIGLNRITWDGGTNPPAAWKGAARKRYQGLPEGPSVPPGTYTIRMKLGGKMFSQRVLIKPDPRSKFTQAEYEKEYHFGQRYLGYFSNIDVMLNNLDAAKKQLKTAIGAATKKANTALVTKLQAAMSAHDAIFSTLTANFHNDEDSIERPGALREDFEGLAFGMQGLITPAVEQFGGRLATRYFAAAKEYNAYAASLSGLTGELKAIGLQPISGVATIKP